MCPYCGMERGACMCSDEEIAEREMEEKMIEDGGYVPDDVPDLTDAELVPDADEEDS